MHEWEGTLSNPAFAKLLTTIFTVMSALASEHGAVNLGHGFPDADGPEVLISAICDEVYEHLDLGGRTQARTHRPTVCCKRLDKSCQTYV